MRPNEAREIRVGTGRHQVLLRLWNSGAGLVVSLTGGDAPHVGGVVLAVPRPSLTGEGMSCDIWDIPVPGHLDNRLSVKIARLLCLRTGVTVSMTAGLHIDSAAESDLTLLEQNALAALGGAFDCPAQ